MSHGATHAAVPRANDMRARRQWGAVLPWALVGVCWVAFALLAVCVVSGRSVRLDVGIVHGIEAMRLPWLTPVMRWLTRFGDGWTLGVLSVTVAYALWRAGYRRAALFVLCVSAGVGLVDNALKLVFARERPEASLRMVRASGYAFPSGHAMASTAVYVALAHVLCGLSRSRRWWAIPMAALLAWVVGCSRVYLNVHHPTDVLGGWVLGLGWYVLLVQLMLRGDRGLEPRRASLGS